MEMAKKITCVGEFFKDNAFYQRNIKTTHEKGTVLTLNDVNGSMYDINIITLINLSNYPNQRNTKDMRTLYHKYNGAIYNDCDL